MKKLYSLLLIAIAEFCTCASADTPAAETKIAPPDRVEVQVFDPLDKKQPDFKGLVKSFLLETATAEEKDGKLVEGPRKFETSMQFDRKGHLTERIEEGQERDSKIRLVYTYGAAGKLLQAAEWECSESKAPRILYKHIYNYDANGNATRETVYFQGSLHSKSTCKYDSSGRPTERAYYWPIDKLRRTTTFEYAPTGKLTSEVTHYADGSEDRIDYKRDSNGNPAGWTMRKGDGTLIQRDESTWSGKRCQSLRYDEHNKLVVKIITEDRRRVSMEDYGPDGSVTRRMTRTYELDTHGNPTKSVARTELIKDGKVDSKTIEVAYWTITYYE